MTPELREAVAREIAPDAFNAAERLHRREVKEGRTPDAASELVNRCYGEDLGVAYDLAEALISGPLAPVLADRDRLQSQLTAREAEIEGLRAGIQAFLDGNYEHPRQYRPCRCPHGVNYWDECPSCNEAHFLRLLAPEAANSTIQPGGHDV